MNKKNITITGIIILFLIILGLIFVNRNVFFKNQEVIIEEEEFEENVKKITKQEIEYILSLPRATIFSLGEDYFIAEIDYYKKRIKVNIKNETKFIVYDNHLKDILIPEEYENWLSKFYYIKNFIGDEGEEYIVHIYFDTEEDLGQDKEKGILDFDEVNATYIAWQYYLKNLNEN